MSGALVAAGNNMMGSGGSGKITAHLNLNTLGVRSLREGYLKPASRSDVVRNLRIIEERYLRDAATLPPIASEERETHPRFQRYFATGELIPTRVFLAALELQPSECLNGHHMQFDADVLVLRDNLVVAYKPLVAKIRQVHSKELDDIPLRPIAIFAQAWHDFESVWLQNREVHAVQALQPLAKAILSLEPLLLSLEKEQLLPWPRIQHQKVITMRCLEGFLASLNNLAASILPSRAREFDHDPRLLLLLDHVLTLRGPKNVNSCLDGASATPDVVFPNYRFHKGDGVKTTLASALHSPSGGASLDEYAFNLLGASVGDAAALGKLSACTGHTGRAKLAMSGTSEALATLRCQAPSYDTGVGPKETEISKKSAVLAEELLHSFEGIKDFLLSLKSTLEHIDPALDRDEGLVSELRRFERNFRKAKKLLLEPDNLA